MVEEYKKTPTIENDEIDFYELISLPKKRFKLILSIFVIVTVFIGIISFMMPPIYQSKFIIKPASMVSIWETKKMIEYLDELVKEGDLKKISDKLGIKEGAEEIVSIGANTIPRGFFVEVIVEVKDPTLVEKLRDGILNYFNQNQYISEKISQNIKKLKKQSEEIRKRIEGMEAFKDTLSKEIIKGARKELGFNPMLLEKEIITLKHELYELENKIQLAKGYAIVSEPFIPRKPIKPRKLLNIAMAGIISLFLGLFLAFFLELVEKHKKKKV